MSHTTTSEETDIWLHPLNRDVPQKNKDHFNAVKSFFDKHPSDDKGNKKIDENELINFLNSFNGCNAQIPK